MGTTFQNLHVRADDPEEVFARFRQTSDARLLITRSSTCGMVSVYPQHDDDLLRAARSISAQLRTQVLAFDVYDSDTVAIRLFSRGKLVVRHENAFEGRMGRRGNADVLAKHANASPTVALRILREDPVFAEAVAIAVGELFGLPRALSVYRYDAFPAAAPPVPVVHAEAVTEAAADSQREQPSRHVVREIEAALTSEDPLVTDHHAVSMPQRYMLRAWVGRELVAIEHMAQRREVPLLAWRDLARPPRELVRLEAEVVAIRANRAATQVALVTRRWADWYEPSGTGPHRLVTVAMGDGTLKSLWKRPREFYIAWAPDGRSVVCAMPRPQSAFVLDADSGEERRRIALPSRFRLESWGADGISFVRDAYLGRPRLVLRCDVDDGALTDRPAGERVSPDGRWRIVGEPDALLVFDEHGRATRVKAPAASWSTVRDWQDTEPDWFGASGIILVGRDDEELVLNLESFELRRLLPRSQKTDLRFQSASADGRLVLFDRAGDVAWAEAGWTRP